MSKIIAFAGSNSSTSINYKLVKHTVSSLTDHEVQLLNLAHYPFPMYGEDLEKSNGFSNSLVELLKDIKDADGVVISVNEHNSNISAYFKNLLDWLSRIDKNFLADKPVLLMSTSNGKRGALSALESTTSLLPRFGANVVASFSLPLFTDNLGDAKTISDASLASAHKNAVDTFIKAI